MTAEDRDALDGLGQLHAMIATGRQAPIGETMKFALVEVDSRPRGVRGQPGSQRL